MGLDGLVFPRDLSGAQIIRAAGKLELPPTGKLTETEKLARPQESRLSIRRLPPVLLKAASLGA